MSGKKLSGSIAKIPVESCYMSGGPSAICDRNFLVDFLDLEGCALDIEKTGNEQSKKFLNNFFYLNLSLKKVPRIRFEHGVVGEKWFWANTSFVDRISPYLIAERFRLVVFPCFRVRFYHTVTQLVAHFNRAWK